ncbi:hypothetical protein [Lactococcus garvieae]|uniref:hypothetical protein n=1 Tax=Lactococcus garvieae TaxID=1363 RepID=UPI0028934A20|nr:hypothetical protein [Lactococcus garvieae]
MRNIDEEFSAHRQAWLNRKVKAEKEVGKRIEPVYATFKQFFDYDNLTGEKTDDTHQVETFESRISKMYQKRKGGK